MGISYWTLAGLDAVSMRLGGRWHLQRRPGNPTCCASSCAAHSALAWRASLLWHLSALALEGACFMARVGFTGLDCAGAKATALVRLVPTYRREAPRVGLPAPWRPSPWVELRHGTTERCPVHRRALRSGAFKQSAFEQAPTACVGWLTRQSARVVGAGCHLPSIPNSVEGAPHCLPTKANGVSLSKRHKLS